MLKPNSFQTNVPLGLLKSRLKGVPRQRWGYSGRFSSILRLDYQGWSCFVVHLRLYLSDFDVLYISGIEHSMYSTCTSGIKWHDEYHVIWLFSFRIEHVKQRCADMKTILCVCWFWTKHAVDNDIIPQKRPRC